MSDAGMSWSGSHFTTIDATDACRTAARGRVPTAALTAPSTAAAPPRRTIHVTPPERTVMTSTTLDNTNKSIWHLARIGSRICEQHLGDDDAGERPTTRDWYWAFDFLLDALDGADSADDAVRDLTGCCERFYTGDPGRWSVLWMLCLNCDTALHGGGTVALVASVTRMASRFEVPVAAEG